MPKHHDQQYIEGITYSAWCLGSVGSHVEITLVEGDSAWHPEDPQTVFTGTGKMVYKFHIDSLGETNFRVLADGCPWQSCVVEHADTITAQRTAPERDPSLCSVPRCILSRHRDDDHVDFTGTVWNQRTGAIVHTQFDPLRD